MTKIKMAKGRLILCLFGACILWPYNAAEARIEIRGASTFGLNYSLVENEEAAKDEDIYPGLGVGLNLALLGRLKGLDLSGVLNSRYDGGGLKIDTIRLDAHSPRSEISVGDYYHSISEFTLKDIHLRGLRLSTRLKKFNICLLGGRSREAEDKTDEESGSFARFLYGVRGEVFPLKNTSVGVTYLAGRDDEGSAEVAEGVNPVKGDTISIDGGIRLTDNVRLDAEYSQSNYDEAPEDGISEDVDNAYRIETRAWLNRVSLKGRYYRIGPEYNSLGLNWVDQDREGYNLSGEYRLGRSSIGIGYEWNHDNLKDEDDKPTVDTNAVEMRFNLYHPSYPKLELKYKLIDRMSDRVAGASPQRVDRTTTILSLSTTFKLKGTRMNLSLQSLDYDDESEYGSDYTPSSYTTHTGSLGICTQLGKFISLMANLSGSNTDNLPEGRPNQSLNLYSSVEYRVIPNKLSLIPQFKSSSRLEDGILTHRDTEIKIEFDWYISEGKKLSVEYGSCDFRDYKDATDSYRVDKIGAKLILPFAK